MLIWLLPLLVDYLITCKTLLVLLITIYWVYSSMKLMLFWELVSKKKWLKFLNSSPSIDKLSSSLLLKARRLMIWLDYLLNNPSILVLMMLLNILLSKVWNKVMLLLKLIRNSDYSSLSYKNKRRRKSWFSSVLVTQLSSTLISSTMLISPFSIFMVNKSNKRD